MKAKSELRETVRAKSSSALHEDRSPSVSSRMASTSSRAEGQFGIELEFFLLDQAGYPALGSASKMAKLAAGCGLSVVPEFGSFQIEINPGPWTLTARGRMQGLNQLRAETFALRFLAEEQGLELCPRGLIPKISPEILRDREFFTDLDRFAASRRHFGHRRALLRLEDGTEIEFPGESAIACINELHLNIQLENDQKTIALFNVLNAGGYRLAERFLSPQVVNQMAVAQTHNTMTLFEQANGELDATGSTRRVGFLPFAIDSFEDYQRALDAFIAIPTDRGFLPLESTVYFWVRLRGRPGSLRVEYRPPEMGPNWESTIFTLLELVDSIGGDL